MLGRAAAWLADVARQIEHGWFDMEPEIQSEIESAVKKVEASNTIMVKDYNKKVGLIVALALVIIAVCTALVLIAAKVI